MYPSKKWVYSGLTLLITLNAQFDSVVYHLEVYTLQENIYYLLKRSSYRQVFTMIYWEYQ